MSGKLHTFEEVRSLIENGETDTVELKLRLPSEEIIAKNLAAFANTAGGIFIVGAASDGKVVGESAEEAVRTKERIERVAASLIPGRIRQVANVSANGQVLTVAEVRPPSTEDGPIITSTGEYFRRVGASAVHKQSELVSLLKDTFEQKPKTISEITVFVAMSFRSEEEPALVDYFRAMQRAAARVPPGINIRRMDQVEGDYEISQEVMGQIDSAEVVLADYTLSPANVYFEAGYARGKSKTLIQTARKGTTLEFDVRNWRTLFYRNATELEELLVVSFGALRE